MLRSIFSLIQRLIDSDKKYNNTKSKAVIYCLTNPDSTISMDLEIDGNRRKVLKNLEYHEKPPIEGSADKTFSIKTEQGDNVKCSHKMGVSIVPKGQKSSDKDEKGGQRVTFANTKTQQMDEELGRDVEGEVQPNVKDLIEHFPTKRMDLSLKEKDQISSLLEQIQKMKTGLQRLQDIALQFNASERFTEDVNYLVNNVTPYLKGQADNKESTKGEKVSPKSVK